MSDILTYDQYAEIEKRGFEMPYIVAVQRAKQRLLFYGSEHSTDPKHPQFQDIENRWGAFIAEASKSIALVEGRFDGVSKEETIDRLRSIKGGGESELLVHLARRDNIDLASPEPDRTWEANRLAKEFGREKVVFYYFMRQVGWWNKAAKRQDIEAEAVKMLHLMQTAYEWDDVEFSIPKMTQIHEDLFAKPLTWDDVQWVYGITTPVSLDYVTNEISRRSGELRDEYILQQITHYWRAGRSPFAVFGSAHAIMLEPALRKLAKA